MGSPAKDILQLESTCGIQKWVLGGSFPSNINPAVLLNCCELSMRYNRRRFIAYTSIAADSAKSSTDAYKIDKNSNKYVAGKIGEGKDWRIWQITHDSPNNDHQKVLLIIIFYSNEAIHYRKVLDDNYNTTG